ncbi:hypothetical protein [Amorphus sp. MBR-141]
MAGENPFSALLPAVPPAEGDSAAFAVYGLTYAAESLWDLLDELPVKADAKLAQRRLQEMVFWGSRAAGGAG